MRVQIQGYDFTWIRAPNPAWSKQKRISRLKARDMMMCLFYYNFDVALVMHYLSKLLLTHFYCSGPLPHHMGAY